MPCLRAKRRDQTAILGMARSLLVSSSNYEDGATNGGLIHIYDFQRNAAGDSLLDASFSTGHCPLRMWMATVILIYSRRSRDPAVSGTDSSC
jgi:hypothetical protein